MDKGDTERKDPLSLQASKPGIGRCEQNLFKQLSLNSEYDKQNNDIEVGGACGRKMGFSEKGRGMRKRSEGRK